MRRKARLAATIIIFPSLLFLAVFFSHDVSLHDQTVIQGPGGESPKFVTKRDYNNRTFVFSSRPAANFKYIDLPSRGKGWRWLAVSFIAYHWDVYREFNGAVYEFGVARGNSISEILAAFQYFHLGQPKVWGFDSFKGIPKEKNGVLRPAGWNEGTYDYSIDGAPGWKCYRLTGREGAGGRKCDQLLSSAKPLSVSEQIERMTAAQGFHGNVRFIHGFYNESLRPGLAEKEGMLPAIYIDIDCDLYISTYQALDWAFKNGIAVVGTLIGYDDWCTTPLGTAGESLAHAEIAEKYGVRLECVLGGCTSDMIRKGRKRYHNMLSGKLLNPIFLVTEVGAKNVQTGVHGYPSACILQSNAWQHV